MGNSVSRPSCLGDKSRKSERFLKECCLKKDSILDIPSLRNNAEPSTGPGEKKQNELGLEKELNVTSSIGKNRVNDPLPKQNNAEANVQNVALRGGTPISTPEHADNVWTPQRGTLQRTSGSSWSWKQLATKEVTEVTEVTETIVTEIVEVTQYPSGDKSGEPIVTRTVKVLTECAGELSEVQTSREAQTDSQYRMGQWDTFSKTVAQRSLPLPVDWQSPEPLESLDTVLSWVSDMEELIEAQKPPSSEAKVVKAQLQEQKLLQKLLEERRPRIERVLLGRNSPSRPLPIEDVGQKCQGSPLSELRDRWDSLIQKAEARHHQLERITPAAQTFQESLDTFQDWVSATERQLAELWRATGSMNQIKEAHQEVQVLCNEVQAKAGELEAVLEKGQMLLELVSGEEAQLSQEKMDSLRVRYVIIAQSASDIQQRLDRTLEATASLDSSQEDVSLWLGRMEKMVSSMSSEGGEGEQTTLSASDMEKLEQIVKSETDQLSKIEGRLQGLMCDKLDLETIQSQLNDQKLLSVEILQHRGMIERLHAVSDALLSLCPDPTQEHLKVLLTSLRELCSRVVLLGATSPACLEHALSLIGQFSEAEEELKPWMEEMQLAVGQLSITTVGTGDYREQQEQLQTLREVVAEHKPLVTKLHRVACKLCELSPAGAGGFQLRFEASEKQYCSIREAVRQAAAILEDTVPRYSQLSERSELMSECLERLRDRVQRGSSVRGEPSRIREQLQDNRLVQAELEKVGVALENIRRQGTELVSSVPARASQPQVIQQRTEQLLVDWQSLRGQAEERDCWLSSLLALAERFWNGLSDLALTLNDTQQMVLDTEDPGSDPDTIRTRLDAMQALREDIDTLQNDLDVLGTIGVELMSSCGDMEKPDVTKSLDELYNMWNGLNKLWTERYIRLEEQLKVTLRYQETTQRLQDWLVSAESRLSEKFLVGGDLDVVKRQLADLKEFKRELYQHRVEMESLGHHGPCRTSADSLLTDYRERWDRLEEEAVNRQHQLEDALLGLGQFQNQLEELLNWLSHTTEQLQGPRAPCIDLQACEIELAKHKVLRNDVLSHSRTVESVDEAGRGILLSSPGDGAESLQARLEELNQRWEYVRGETERRQLELENDLSRVQDVTLEITDLLQWLEHVDMSLSFSKPVWGHPQSTREALTKHLDLCKDMEYKQHTYNSVRDRLQRLLASHPLPHGSSADHQLRILEQKWESVYSKVQDRKVRLSDGLAVVTEFHNTMQEVSLWIGQVEGRISAAGPPSVILETVTNQIQEHKGLVQEIQAHEEKLSSLESVCSRLKNVSRKQEGDLTQSLLQSARERLGKVQEKAGDRGRSLEEARRQAKQFSESSRMLLDWLQEVDRSLRSQPIDTSMSQENIKQELSQHKEFQKILRSKRPVYEATLRSGRALREKVRLAEDGQRLDEALGQLRERWEHVCNRSTERQQKLEESLLFSGKFTDGLQALMDWLYRAEPQLSEEMPVGGDRDLVTDLLDKHKAFQKELGKRAGCMKTLKHSVRDLSRGGVNTESHWLQRQMEELGHRWDLVCQLSVSKQARLEASLHQAMEFHSLVSSFLESLGESERTLKYGVIPEDEQALQECQRQQQELMSSLQCQQMALECIVSLGQEILSACHPDSVITIKSWLNITNTRYQEVVSWAHQQGERIQSQIQTLATEREEVTRLIDWITAAEEALSLRDQEPLPEEMDAMEEIISQHTVFMEELNRKEPEVERVTKNCKRKVTETRTPNSRKNSAKRQISLKAAAQAGSSVPLLDLVPQTPHLAQLLNRWQQLWFLALDRQCRLHSAQQRLHELQEFAHFDFAVWRKRYMQWIGQMKSRILDVFRGIDRDQDGRISQREFVDSVLSSRFPTNLLEMNAVANIFDINGDGFIDYYEFVSALHPTRDPLRKGADADQIQDEVNRQVAQCNCAKRFQVEQISANRYRFGESQQLRMVRILRSSLMVRVGGGWIALDEFLVKNDPCRVKGRTNLKINEKYLSPDSFSSSSPLRGGGNQSNLIVKGMSRSRSNSSLSLYSSSSAPTSPQSKKTVLRRTRSGDRSRTSLITDGTDLKFSATHDDAKSTSAEKTDTPPT